MKKTKKNQIQFIVLDDSNSIVYSRYERHMSNVFDKVAELITDGCNMGIKSLNKYLNQYKMADEISKKVTEKLIRLEEDLRKDLRIYL